MGYFKSTLVIIGVAFGRANFEQLHLRKNSRASASALARVDIFLRFCVRVSPCQVYFQWGLFRPLVKFTSNGGYSIPLPSLLPVGAIPPPCPVLTPMGVIPSPCQVYFQWGQ